MGKRILLVDDESGVREALKLLLSDDSHTVVEANNGAEALDLFRKSRFDLVMTDFRIPFMRGDELALAMRRLVPNQPILMITAYPQLRGPHNPVDAVLRKPFGHIRLRETVAKLLDRPAVESEIISPNGASSPESVHL
jgi:CheY-like chemotaxis protein